MNAPILYNSICKNAPTLKTGSVSFPDVAGHFLKEDQCKLAIDHSGYIPHLRLTGGAHIAAKIFQGFQIECLVLNEKVILYLFFDGPAPRDTQEIRIFINGKVYQIFLMEDLPRTHNLQNFRNREARVIEIPFPENRTRMAVEISSQTGDLFGAVFAKTAPESSGKTSACGGGFLGLDVATNELIGWAIGADALGHHAVVEVSINGRLVDFVASYALRDRAKHVPGKSRLYRIGLSDLGAGLPVKGGASVYRLILKSGEPKVLHRRGAFYLIRNPNGQTLWWRARIQRSGHLVCSASLLNHPKKTVKATIRLGKKIIWQGAMLNADPVDLRFPTRNNSLECPIPRLRFNRLLSVCQLGCLKLTITFEVDGVEFWTQRMNLNRFFR